MNIYTEKNVEIIIRQLLAIRNKKKNMPETIVDRILERRELKSEKSRIQIKRNKIKKQLNKAKRQAQKVSEIKSKLTIGTLGFLEKREKLKDIISDILLTSNRVLSNLEQLIDQLTPILIQEEENLSNIRERLEESKKAMEDTISNYASEFLSKIRRKDFEPSLESFKMGKNNVMRVDNFDSAILMSLITEDIKQYKRQPEDRNRIVGQLKGILDNELPKYVIRADVKSCFENISFKSMIDKLEIDGYVSNISLKFLKKIRSRTNDVCQGGVPRGLSFSSYLVELYFQEIDREILKIPGVYFYKRYVDDIILIGYPENCSDQQWKLNELNYYWLLVKDIFVQNHLELHENDSKQKLMFYNQSTTDKFDYLGYKFCVNKGKLEIRLASKKRERYRNTIDKIIASYNITARENQSLPEIINGKRRVKEQPLRRLFGQLSCFTGNGKLTGYKSSILTGIYYSNIHLTSDKDFKDLDKILISKIDKDLQIPKNLFKYDKGADVEETQAKIKNILKRWTFTKGFNERRFCKHSRFCQRMREIKNLTHET